MNFSGILSSSIGFTHFDRRNRVFCENTQFEPLILAKNPVSRPPRATPTSEAVLPNGFRNLLPVRRQAVQLPQIPF
jgi:hypothetical protein